MFDIYNDAGIRSWGKDLVLVAAPFLSFAFLTYWLATRTCTVHSAPVTQREICCDAYAVLSHGARDDRD